MVWRSLREEGQAALRAARETTRAGLVGGGRRWVGTAAMGRAAHRSRAGRTEWLRDAMVSVGGCEGRSYRSGNGRANSILLSWERRS